jgi:hypothetical protein
LEAPPTNSTGLQNKATKPQNSFTGNEIEIKTEIIDEHKEDIVVTAINGDHTYLHTFLPNEVCDFDIKDIKPGGKPKVITIKKALNREIPHSVVTPYEVDILIGRVKVLKKAYVNQQLKIKTLAQRVRRCNKHVVKLNIDIKNLREKNEELRKKVESYSTLPNISPLCNDMMKRQLAKKEGRELEQKYPPEIRDFAINLNCYSPLAYRYVREAFNEVLPHQKTLEKWQSKEARMAELEVPTETMDAVASISTETVDVSSFFLNLL